MVPAAGECDLRLGFDLVWEIAPPAAWFKSVWHLGLRVRILQHSAIPCLTGASALSSVLRRCLWGLVSPWALM